MRLTPHDWFAMAETLLVEEGPGALTIERLTGRAGVTKGSFYHHFGSRQGFVAAFVEHLRDVGFADIVAEVDPVASPQLRLHQLVAELARHDPGLEIAVRRWAVIAEPVREMLEEVDAAQLDYLAALFGEMTDPDMAAFQARLSIAFHLGSLQIRPPIHGAEYAAMAEALGRIRSETGPQATP
ncbi:MAG: helix-turn-helix transcriptional regulator [Acidimicrobiia bacterium]|nr:helix-turn-helix transcriptional regulator [Acidimicrobiia bacterium]